VFSWQPILVAIAGTASPPQLSVTIRGRTEVNEAIFAGITARMGPDGRHRARGLLNTPGSDGRSMFNRLKKPARRATWSRFKA